MRIMNIPRKTRFVEHSPAPLLINRHRACALLGGISVATLQRLEAAHKLTPIKLSGHPSSCVFYRIEDVERLARGEREGEA
jgi:hypothetical protein